MEFNIIKKKNLLELCVATENEISFLNKHFNKQVDNWHFIKRFQKGNWNGVVEFFKWNKYIPLGLYGEVLDIAKKFNMQCCINGIENLKDNINWNKFNNWQKEFFLSNKYQLRDYQIKTAFNILQNKKCLAELATSAGKTLICFTTIAYQLKHNKKTKCLIIVPTVDLVTQTIEDFEDYDCNNKCNLRLQPIFSGSKRVKEANVVVGTYQSLVNKKRNYFKDFTTVIVDEVHKAKALSIRKILQSTLHCKYRYGVTGTIQRSGSIDRYNIMAYTGPIVSEVKAKYLMDRGFITKAHVKILKIQYNNNKLKKHLCNIALSGGGKQVLELERQYIHNHKKRLNFVCTVAERMKGNTLVLFHRKLYGQKIKKHLESKNIVYYIDGDTESKSRRYYVKQAEQNENIIIVASFGTFATGINLKNLVNIICAESFKDDKIIRQALGRGLRLHKNKNKMYFIDLWDDLTFKNNNRLWLNYLYKHGQMRLQTYISEQFNYTIKNVNL